MYLGEVPTLAQYMGGSVILFGIFLTQVGKKQKTSRRDPVSMVKSTPAEQEVETGIGFKGI